MAESNYDPSTDVIINEDNFEVLIAKLIPTSQYFERSFQMLQNQMGDFKEEQKELKADINRRFEEVHQGQKDMHLDMDKRFEEVHQGQKDMRLDMDKRFELVDRRFEQVDKRFDQVNAKLDIIIERMDVKIDAGLREARSMSIRLFSFAMIFSAISMAGFLAKMTGLF